MCDRRENYILSTKKGNEGPEPEVARNIGRVPWPVKLHPAWFVPPVWLRAQTSALKTQKTERTETSTMP